ncbi:MAG TPA: hypothetical protein VF691_23095 [Cytophagaceae bacterium]|jgi:hypothetical protein
MNINIKKSSATQFSRTTNNSSLEFQSSTKGPQESTLNIHDLVVRNENETYYVEALQSRPAYGIDLRDILVVDRSVVASNHLVLAVVEGNFEIKKIVKTHNKLYVQSDTDNLIEISDTIDFKVWGVIMWIIKSPYLRTAGH